jgi:rod shape-determining protein MreD
MAQARASTFWTFIGILVLLHLTLRVGLGLTVIPDLITAALLLGARRLAGWHAALYGLVLGILADSLAVVGFGATAVAYVIVGYLGSRSRSLFEGESHLFAFVYVFLGGWLVEAIRYFTSGAAGRGIPLSYLLADAALGALYLAIAAVVAMIAYRAVTGNR